MSIKNYTYVLRLFLGLFLPPGLFVSLLVGYGPNTQAQGLWGSGAYQGQMICPYEPKTSRAAFDVSDEEREERKEIAKLKLESKVKQKEVERNENQLERLRTKLERHLDASILEFLLDTHIEGAKTCAEYRTAHAKCNPQAVAVASTGSGVPADQAASVNQLTVTPTAPKLSDVDQVFCDGLIEPPELLSDKWNTKNAAGRGGYCIGSSKSNAGLVHSSICSDEKLRPTDSTRRSYNAAECARALTEYRKKTIDLGNAADKEERLQDEIEDRAYKISDIRDRARLERLDTESDCEDCDNASRGYAYRKPPRDWISTGVHVLGGIGLMAYGKKAEQAANEYNAQAGWPSSESYGYPFYQAGMHGVINGLVGPGAYGCSSATGGAGFPFGAGGGWNLGGAANGAFGPFAGQGGAFGYPQDQFGSPWGGGAFMPGFGPGGMMNGPGGLGGGLGIGGGMQPPLGMGGMMPPPFGIGGGLQPPFGMGQPPFMPPMNPLMNNGGLSAQYQLQMLQMQQQMQQQQMQQQMQYYQAQMQQRQQQLQQYYARQQQVVQIQMQMAQLTAQLQALQQQSYYGSGGSLGGGIGGGFGLGISVGIGGGIGVGAPSPSGLGGGLGVGLGVGGFNGGTYPLGTVPPYQGIGGVQFPVGGPGSGVIPPPGQGAAPIRGR